MHVQIRTDNHITNTERLSEWVASEVESAVAGRYNGRLHRVDVHLRDENAHKGGLDKRCSIEAHLSGHQPIAVQGEGADLDAAVMSAVRKLTRSIEHTLGRIDDRADRNGRAVPLAEGGEEP